MIWLVSVLTIDTVGNTGLIWLGDFWDEVEWSVVPFLGLGFSGFLAPYVTATVYATETYPDTVRLVLRPLDSETGL